MSRSASGAASLALLLAACTGAPSETVDATSPEQAAGEPSPSATERASRSASPSAVASEADALLGLELVDVRTGESFTLRDLAADKPVLVETMAIWCTSCRAQQREVVRAHELGDFHSVGIDVDPNERPGDLAEYSAREGFDWRFVKADAQLVDLLTDLYGFAVTNPPSTPTFIVSESGIRALEFGRIRPADELLDEIAAG